MCACVCSKYTWHVEDIKQLHVIQIFNIVVQKQKMLKVKNLQKFKSESRKIN